jgi:hypothetical protein
MAFFYKLLKRLTKTLVNATVDIAIVGALLFLVAKYTDLDQRIYDMVQQNPVYATVQEFNDNLKQLRTYFGPNHGIDIYSERGQEAIRSLSNILDKLLKDNNQGTQLNEIDIAPTNIMTIPTPEPLIVEQQNVVTLDSKTEKYPLDSALRSGFGIIVPEDNKVRLMAPPQILILPSNILKYVVVDEETGLSSKIINSVTKGIVSAFPPIIEVTYMNDAPSKICIIQQENLNCEYVPPNTSKTFNGFAYQLTATFPLDGITVQSYRSVEENNQFSIKVEIFGGSKYPSFEEWYKSKGKETPPSKGDFGLYFQELMTYLNSQGGKLSNLEFKDERQIKEEIKVEIGFPELEVLVDEYTARRTMISSPDPIVNYVQSICIRDASVLPVKWVNELREQGYNIPTARVFGYKSTDGTSKLQIPPEFPPFYGDYCNRSSIAVIQALHDKIMGAFNPGRGLCGENLPDVFKCNNETHIVIKYSIPRPACSLPTSSKDCQTKEQEYLNLLTNGLNSQIPEKLKINGVNVSVNVNYK